MFLCESRLDGEEERLYVVDQKDEVGRFYEEVGQRIRDAREARLMTQEALAAEVSLTRTSITNVEKGRQKLLLHTFFDIAQVLGVSAETLLPSIRTGSDSDLEDHLKGRPSVEQEWLRQSLTNRRKG